MHKSLSKKGEISAIPTDRTKARSTDKQIKGLSYIREIVIKTDEPDLPQITIFKVERPQKSEAQSGFHQLERIIERMRLKRLFQGFSQISSLIHSSKVKLINTNRLVNLLKGRQKKLVNYSWVKLANLRIRQKNKLDTSRLLSKISLILVNKAKLTAFNKLKSNMYLKIKRSITETSQSTVRKAEQNFQMQMTKLRNLQISDKFATVCKKLLKLQGKKLIDGIVSQLQMATGQQIERYQNQKNKQGLPMNTQVVLIIVNNQIAIIKQLKNQNQSSSLIIKQFQKEDFANKLAFFHEAEKEFEESDNQIRISFEKHNRIQEKQLGKIIEAQLIKWNKLREHSLYNSRLFLSAIIAKMAKQSFKPLNEFVDKLQAFLRICADIKKIEEFKKNIANNQERTNIILLQISNKFIDLTTFGMQPIMQKGFSENQQIFMSEIRSMKQQMKEFIAKYNNPNERPKLKKTFSSKMAKAPEELRDLYSTLNDLVALIKLNEVPKSVEASVKNEIYKILNTFNICLKEGNYKKWENFLKQIKKEDYSQLLDILDKINEILNQKINSESQQSSSQLEKLRNNEKILNETINNLKAKNIQLQKKIKIAEQTKQKQQNKKETEEQNEWQNKYKVMLQKYQKLEKDGQKSRSASKALGERETSALKKKIDDKDSQIEKLRVEIKSVRQKSIDKIKYETDKKKFDNDQKQLKNNYQKLKEEIQNKIKIIVQNQSNIKKLEEEIKRLSNQNSVLKGATNKAGVKQGEYGNLNKRLSEITLKYESSIQQRDEKQLQLQKLRTFVINQQSKISEIETSRADRQSLLRKINVLTNSNESLKRDLQQKSRQFQQLNRERKIQGEGRKGSKSTLIGSGNVESSLQLIKQLNLQLQKLKRNEITLEQINKQLQNAHNRGQDVQVLISKIETENNQFKKNMIQRDKIIFELKNQISRLTTELALVNPQINKLTNQLNDKDQNLRRLEASIKDRQILNNKQLQNKRDYIKKLQGIIGVNESMINDLNIQINKLKTKQIQVSPMTRNQIETMENTIKQLRNSNSKFVNIQVSFIDLQKRYNFERVKWEDQKKRWEQEKRKWDLQRTKIQQQIRRLSNLTQTNTTIQLKYSQIQKKYTIDRRTWEGDRIKWEEQKTKWQFERTKMQQQIKRLLNNSALQIKYSQLDKRYNIDRRNWEGDRIKWDEQKRKWQFERVKLQQQIKRSLNMSQLHSTLQLKYSEMQKKYTIDRRSWEGERLKWDQQLKIWQRQKSQLQGQIEKALRSSKVNSNLQFAFGQLQKKYNFEKNIWSEDKKNWEIQRNRLQKQIQNWLRQIKRWEGQKINWNNDRQKLELQWKGFVSKYEQVSLDNGKLIEQLNALKGIINDLRAQIALISGSSINVDNIVLLLANITSNFIRITPKQNKVENQKTFDIILKDLMGIKEKFVNVQQQMFINLERYIVTFVESDIGKYRYELMMKIEELTGLKQRLTEFLNNQIQISKKNMSYQYSYEIKQVSTAAKSLYETPMKTFETGFKMAAQIRQAKQKSINPQRLF